MLEEDLHFWVAFREELLIKIQKLRKRDLKKRYQWRRQKVVQEKKINYSM